MIVGIQGGPGSFSQQAAKHILQKKGIKYEIKNLYTTDKVLNALHIGDIDRGVFAVHNSVGGVVHESVNAMAKFKFKIIEEFSIIIAHSLIIRPDAKLEDIDTIMTHPQVIKQCKNTLKKKYPTIKLTSGKAQLIDHSKVASMLKQKKLGKNIATMGSSDLAKLNNLKIVEENLQDQNQNHTSFFWVKRT
ncbi:MAG: Prephenate dehydratase [Candidatus Woesearchaeota archaeon]|nr:Prephenate dehydratase [Candidatus Woesearchaeota archaeon]